VNFLLVEDRASLRNALKEILEREGYEVQAASEGGEAMTLIVSGGYDLALFDLKMPVHNGLELLKESRSRWPSVPVILLTAYGSVETAVEAMKEGAFDFLSKPVDPDLLLLRIQRALEIDRRERVGEAVKADLSRHPMFQGMIGESPAFRESLQQAERIAAADTTVLLLGETGVGKELFSRAIHLGSARKSHPFVAVNCAAIPGTLLENELFGHEKGAYTGAHESKMGRFELAHRGTLFLDEIGEMHPDLQSKLLRVLEDRTFFRVGGNRPIKADVRLICATNKDLDAVARDGGFRMDLYYRISAFPIRIPALRDRPEDIPMLAEHYLGHFSKELGRSGLSFTPEAVSWMCRQPWRGNIRELINRIERGAILSEGTIEPLHLRGLEAGAADTAAFPPELLGFQEDPEAWLDLESHWRARQVLVRCGGNRRRAARLLEMKGDRFDALVGSGDE